MTAPEWTWDDGGRAAAGFKGDAGDCVTRAITIAFDRRYDYKAIYDELAAGMGQMTKRDGSNRPRSARNGVHKKVYEPFLVEHGWEWTPTMFIGSGTTVHVREGEIPSGRVILRLSKHLCTAVDGIVHDTSDPSRDGTRAVYGYWKEG